MTMTLDNYGHRFDDDLDGMADHGHWAQERRCKEWAKCAHTARSAGGRDMKKAPHLGFR